MVNGIDVWAGNGAIDWSKVKRCGIEFAYVRAAYGDVADASAAANLTGARAAGIQRGVCHLLRPGKNYPAQIDLMLHLLDTLKIGAGDLPPAIQVLDNARFDGPWNPADSDKFITAIDRWVMAVGDKTGAWPVVHTSAAFWDVLGNATTFGNCPLWVTSYSKAPPRLPRTWNKYAFWQHSDQGKVDGVLSRVNLDYFVGDDPAALNALLLR